MARQHSPGYPNMALSKAISAVQKIFDADRQAPVDRVVAAKHIGYSGQSGASDKALASLAHYGLLEKAGKGETRVTQLAVDILHPESSAARRAALREAGLNPGIFQEIYDRYDGRLPSEEALRSYLLRANFQNVAINPVVNSYSETFRFLEQEKAFESGGMGAGSSADSVSQETSGADDKSSERVFGGAKVGDLIQWESGGVLQLEKPMRVRLVTEDGQWVAVEGSETGIPMQEVLVEERAAVSASPPTFKIAPEPASDSAPREGENEWIANVVGRGRKVRLLVSGGEMGAREIGKLITLLEAQRAVLDDDEDEDAG